MNKLTFQQDFMRTRKYRQERHKFNENLSVIDEYDTRFCEWHTSINLLTTLAAILIFFGVHAALVASNRFFAQNSATILSFPVIPIIWWFFPALATTLSFELVLQVWSLFGYRRIANAYSQWAALQPKSYRGGTTYMDSRDTFNKFFLFLALPIGVLTLLALNMHVALTSQEFIRCGYAFQSCSIHPYSSIRAIYTADGRLSSKHSSFIPSPDIVIDFNDQTRWSEYQWSETNRKVLDTDLLHLLVEKTGLSPKSIHLEEDLPNL